MRKLLFILAFSLLFCDGASSQKIVWDVDFVSVFNNREGGDEQTPDQTFLHLRLTPQIGVSFADGRHTLMGGVSYFQPLNNDWGGHKLTPTFHYRYAQNGWRLSMGFIPRTVLLSDVPKYLWSDSLAYHQPVIRGLLAQKTTRSGYSELMLDWRQLQSETRREAFVVGFNSSYHIGALFTIGGHVQYNHLAKRKNAPEGESVNDDATINPMVGLDFTKRTGLDTLAFRLGPIIQLERNRAQGKWQTPAGFVADARCRYRWIEARETFFAGKDMFPLYEQFGCELNLGDPYYRYKIYSRTDVIAHVVNTEFVDVTASLSAHVTDKMFGFWQQIGVRFYINNDIWRNRKNRDGMIAMPKLRSIY